MSVLLRKKGKTSDCRLMEMTKYASKTVSCWIFGKSKETEIDIIRAFKRKWNRKKYKTFTVCEE